MLIHVQNDGTLHGNVVTVVGSLRQRDAAPREILYAGNLVSVAEAIQIEKDSAVVSTTAAANETYSLHLSKEIQERLCLPSKTTLHCIFDGKTWRMGPCLAIYVRSFSNKKLKFGPQTRLLKDLSLAAGEMGVDVVVISPGFTRSNKGWRYDSEKGTWEESELGRPDIVLRRSGAFENTQGGLVRTELQGFAAEGVLHTLPRFYTNKWMMHRLLSQSSYLKDYLLDTQLASNSDDVFRLSHQYLDVYVKPLTGAQGHRIYRIQRINNALQIQWNKAPAKKGETIPPQKRICFDAQDFADFWSSTGLKRCIVQETFPLPSTREGNPFDLRWLVQFTDSEAVTARMARIGDPDSVTTNLHTGGKPVAAAELFERLKWKGVNNVIASLDDVAIEVAKVCAEKFGPIAELGVDLAVTEQGDIKIFEINSTPGRRMLKLAAPALRTLSLHNLLEYAINAAGFAGES